MNEADENFKEHVIKKIKELKVDLRIYLVDTQNQVEKLNKQINFLEDIIKWLEVKEDNRGGGYSEWARIMSKGGKK